MRPFRDHRWLTFNQVQELGGKVRKGERSTMIVFWKHIEVPIDKEGEEPETKRIPMLRYFQVFNAEQCEGIQLAAIQPSENHEHERIERAELIVQHMPDPPEILEDGKSAWYSPNHDVVQVPPIQDFISPDAYYATLFHELGHSTGHAKRLARKGVMERIQFGSEVYSHEELVAEFASAYLCGAAGLDNSLTGESANYIGGWLQVLENDPKAVVIAATQAQRAADYIQGVTYAS